MEKDSKPYGIEPSSWASTYLCKKCGGLLYYDIKTKNEYCFNSQCQNFPKDIELYSVDNEDLKTINGQIASKEKQLGDMIRTCDYNGLALYILNKRRRIAEQFFAAGIIRFYDFLYLNEILLIMKKYKSFGIRRNVGTFESILKLFNRFMQQLDMLEDLKEQRYLLAKKPVDNTIFRMKYFDIIVNELWASYGLVHAGMLPDPKDFRYNEIIEEFTSNSTKVASTDYSKDFDRLWPFTVSAQYFFKRNHRSALQYKYDITSVDLANVLSIIMSMKNNELTIVPPLNFLMHFIKQPVRGKTYLDFFSMLSGNNDKVPIVFGLNGNIALDRRTLLLFFVYLNSQFTNSYFNNVSGPQRIAQLKQEASIKYQELFKLKLETFGYRCLPESTNIGGEDYDEIAISEERKNILLIELKFRDPSPSSLSGKTLIEQEFIDEEDGLLPQVIKQQKRYDLVFQRGKLFQDKLMFKNSIQEYHIKAYFVTKYTPLMSLYRDVNVLSEKEFKEKELPSII